MWRCFLGLWLLLAGYCPALLAMPEQDLRNWHMDEGLHSLDGQWQLRWIEPQQQQEQLVRLPFTWSHGQPRWWGDSGFGQIELQTRLLLPVGSTPLGLRLPALHSAAAVWIDGRLALLRGQPGDALRELAQLDSAVIPLPPDAPAVEVRILLSNHLRAAGGIASSPQVGELVRLQGDASHAQVLLLLVIGALLMLALLMLLGCWGAGGATLAGMALLASLWLAARGESLDGHLYLSAASVLRGGWLGLWLLPALQARLLVRLGGAVPAWVPQLLDMVTLAGVPVLLLPVDGIERVLPLAAFWLQGCLLLLLGLAARSWYHGKAEAGLLSAGLLLLALIWLGRQELLAPGVAVLLLGQAVLLLQRQFAVSADAALAASHLPDLPALQPAGELPAAFAAVEAGMLPAGLRVLLVGEDNHRRQLALEALQAAGAWVTCADDGERTAELTAVCEYDLVLLDLATLGEAVCGLSRLICEQAGAWGPRIIVLGSRLPEGAAESGIEAVLPAPLVLCELSLQLGSPPDGLAGEEPEPAAERQAGSSRQDDLRRWLGAEAFERLLPEVLVTLREVEQGLCQLDPADEQELTRLCHLLRGSAQNIGLDELAEACTRAGSPAGLQHLQHLLAGQIDQLEHSLGLLATNVDCGHQHG